MSWRRIRAIPTEYLWRHRTRCASSSRNVQSCFCDLKNKNQILHNTRCDAPCKPMIPALGRRAIERRRWKTIAIVCFSARLIAKLLLQLCLWRALAVRRFVIKHEGSDATCRVRDPRRPCSLETEEGVITVRMQQDDPRRFKSLTNRRHKIAFEKSINSGDGVKSMLSMEAAER